MAKKTPKQQKIALYAINVKLRSNKRSGAEAYKALIDSLFNKKVHIDVTGGKSVMLRTKFEQTHEGRLIIFGKISRFTTIEPDKWVKKNLDNKLEPINFEIPPEHFHDLKEIEFYFVPEAHRFCIQKVGGSVSLSNAYEFLRKGLKKVIDREEDIEVTIETDTNIFQEILNAEQIRSVDIEITYSNNDINDEFTEWVDDELRTMHAGSAKIILRPDHNGSLSLDSELLQGALGLAKSNGSVKATIVNENNQKKKVETKDYPLTIIGEVSTEDAGKRGVLHYIMSQFRNAI